MNNVNSQNMLKSNPSFGMALYMNESAIAKNIGHYAADEAKKARPALEDLAKDVDVFVKPDVGSEINLNTLDVYVQDVTPPSVESKNPILNFLRGIKRQWQINSKRYAKGLIFPSHGNTSERLVADVKEQKRIFLQSK